VDDEALTQRASAARVGVADIDLVRKRLAQRVARDLSAPSHDPRRKRRRCTMLAALADSPKPWRDAPELGDGGRAIFIGEPIELRANGASVLRMSTRCVASLDVAQANLFPPEGNFPAEGELSVISSPRAGISRRPISTRRSAC